MIAIVLFVLGLLLLAATPWRRLPNLGRFWAVAAVLNASVFFGVPTTPATSPWRPVAARVLAASAALSLALVVLGLVLRHHHTGAGVDGGAWIGPLMLGALPVVFYVVFWIAGPFY